MEIQKYLMLKWIPFPEALPTLKGAITQHGRWPSRLYLTARPFTYWHVLYFSKDSILLNIQFAFFFHWTQQHGYPLLAYKDLSHCSFKKVPDISLHTDHNLLNEHDCSFQDYFHLTNKNTIKVNMHTLHFNRYWQTGLQNDSTNLHVHQ